MIRQLIYKARGLARYFPALLIWAAFPPFAEAADIFFAFAPLLWYARNRNARQSAKVWFANGFLYWIATLTWMHAIVKNNGPWPLVLLGWFALSAYCALYFGVFGWLSASLWQWTRRHGYCWRLAMLALGEPILWAGLELARSTILGGFSWNHAGSALANMGLGAPAAIGGTYLLSMIAILVNGTFASVAERMLARGASFGRCVETILPLALVFAVYSPARVDRADGKADKCEGRRISAALVQRNFPCAFAAQAQSPRESYSRLFDSVSPASPDILILSESALAEFGQIGSSAARGFALEAMRRTGARAVLAGGTRVDGDGRVYNSAALYMAADGGVSLQTCDKVHLVPFGEFIPGDKMFPVLQRLAPVGSCWPGEPRLLDFEGLKIGVAVCFEDTDAALVRKFAELGADVLVFITNDSWFSQSHEAVQHAWQSVARSIETGLPVLRIGNSGVTGAISPTGARQWLCEAPGRPLVDEAGAMVHTVNVVKKRPTFYAKTGDWPLATAFVLFVLAAVAAARDNRLHGFDDFSA